CASNGLKLFWSLVDEWVISDQDPETYTYLAWPHLWKADLPTGTWEARSFITGSTTSDYVDVYSAGPDPSGTYLGSAGLWELSPWSAIYDAGSNKYYITTNTGALSPSWSKAGSDPCGDYETINGVGIYGVVQAVTNDVGNWSWDEDIETNTIPGGTATVFYSSTLIKTVCTNDSYCITNIEHQAVYFGYMTKPSAGDVNNFGNQGLGFNENELTSLGASEWTWATNSPATFANNAANPPANNATEPEANKTVCDGFVIPQPVKAIVEWRFMYCTNGYW
ncbi:MAG: hypothetical protein KKE37_00775, partial [Verrucomicrobia bacterium]|nr:hypothetical protein [Verrucomicrobiota bacterium]